MWVRDWMLTKEGRREWLASRIAQLLPRRLVYWTVIRAACIKDNYPAEQTVLQVLQGWR